MPSWTVLQLYCCCQCTHPCFPGVLGVLLKVVLQIFRQKIYNNTEKSSLYSQTFWFSFIKSQQSKAIWRQEKLKIFYGPGQHRRETWSIFSSPEHRVLSELLWSLIVRPCPSVHNFLVNTLASTNIYQSAPNLVRMYITIRSQMSSIMEVIGAELSELSALELENLPYLTLLTL